MPGFLVFRVSLLAFLAGVAARDVFPIPPVVLVALGAVAAGALASAVARRWRHGALLGFVCLAVLLGVLRFSAAEQGFQQQTLLSAAGETVSLEGRVMDVDVRRDRVYLLLESTDGPLQGRLRVTVSRYASVAPGDTVQFHCRLRAPGDIEGFDYAGYLRLSRTSAYCRAVDMVVRRSDPHRLAGFLHASRSGLLQAMQRLWPEPESSLVAGLLIGERSGLGPEANDAFRRTGTMHILAISGYNISLIVHFLQRVLAPLVGRKRATFVVVVGIAGFTILVGASASVVRAAIMGCIFVFGAHLGRTRDGANALLAAAAAMVAVNPFVLMSDVGFQLSVAATFGLLTLTPVLEERLRRLPDVFTIRTTLSATLAATIATLPIMVSAFGQLSLIAPVTNILILPLIPVIMLAAACAMLFSVAVPAIGFGVGIGAYGLLHLVLAATEAFARLPWSSVLLPSVPPWVLLVLTGVIGLLWYRFRMRQKFPYAAS